MNAEESRVCLSVILDSDSYVNLLSVAHHRGGHEDFPGADDICEALMWCIEFGAYNLERSCDDCPPPISTERTSD